MDDHYTPQEERLLLQIARAAITCAARGEVPELPALDTLPEALRAPRACFVTLHTRGGALRGCTGVLTARQPLAHEVSRTAVQTALNDPRFLPLRPDELPNIEIELSLLTPPEKLAYDDPAGIPHLLRPHVDGVILRLGMRRATFLPQVWERAPEPEEFLDLLCQKMGALPGSWRTASAEVFTYRAIVIEEQSEPV
jgi:AmmeMemoRadiSam system protein A